MAALVSVPRRDDADNFFATFASPINVNHDVDCDAANPPDGVPALFARFVIDAVFLKEPAFIGKHAGGERKCDAMFFSDSAGFLARPIPTASYI